MRTYRFQINGKSLEVAVKEVDQKKARVEVNGTEHVVAIEEIKNVAVKAAAGNAPAPVVSTPAPAQSAPAPTVSAGGAGSILAPIPGQVKKVHVKVGDSVSMGASLIIMEAMKMENMVASDKQGVVTEVHVKEGDSVNQGQPLVTIGGN
jgi:biotin carboxyl carrier protein